MLKRYLITNSSKYRDEVEFRRYIEKINRYSDIDYIIYRDKENPRYNDFAEIFARSISFEQWLIHQDIELAIKLQSFGVHLTSQQFSEIPKAKDRGLWTLISCHSLEEIAEAERLGADGVTFSPIFETPNKGKPKGIEELRKAVTLFPKIKIFALGGIVSEREIQQLEKVDFLFGFASIRFWC
ncbi:MAG TPA: thiamine phosphate synthase [Campylobacterales bacterium]|nr:thiamine phosphate synthase [Campylobacterales bacterium]